MTEPKQPEHPITENQLYAWTTGFSLAMALVAMAIMTMRGVSIPERLIAGAPLGWQLAVGAGLGLVVATILTIVGLKVAFFKPLRELTREILTLFEPDWANTVFIALCAGFSEELLFRGAFQPWVGIWWAAAFFTVAHALRPHFTWGVVLFLSLVYILGLGLGIVFEQFGLVAAMTAHAVYDFAVLTAMRFLLNRTD